MVNWNLVLSSNAALKGFNFKDLPPQQNLWVHLRPAVAESPRKWPFSEHSPPPTSDHHSRRGRTAFQQQAGESVTRGDRRRRELEARSPSPPLACLLLESFAASGGKWWVLSPAGNKIVKASSTGGY